MNNKIPVLRIRDANGNFIPINAIRGDRGKSAYEQAKEGGYKGTEQEFIALLNGLTSTDDADHYSDFSNPHNVTAQQVGALSIMGGYLQGGLGFVGEGDANTSEIVQNSDYATIIRNKANGIETILALTNETKVDAADVFKLWFANGNGYSIYGEHNKPTASDVGAIPEAYYVSADLNAELQSGDNKMIVCCYGEHTLNTPYTEGLTNCTHGMVITNAFTPEYSTQMCIPSGNASIYVRDCNGGQSSAWKTIANTDDISDVKTRIVTGSYTGTGTYGSNNKNIIPCDFKPSFMIIKSRDSTGGHGIWGGYNMEVVYDADNRYAYNAGLTACGASYSEGMISWYSATGAKPQLNVSGQKYTYLLIE